MRGVPGGRVYGEEGRVNRDEVRGAARALRLRIDAGGTLTMDEALAACVTRDEALSVFERTEEDGDLTRVFCCGEPAKISDGIFGAKVECPHCNARAVDATSPMYSPFLERGNAFVTCPSQEWVDAFGNRTWLVMHEGAR